MIRRYNVQKPFSSIGILILIIGMASSALAGKPTPVTPSTCVDNPTLNQTPPLLIDPNLIEAGRKLFNNETFNGNGRTCATCHRAENNFTIDPTFIATLPQTDPLFVAENNPALVNLENPKMMRQFGLICENLDGFPIQPAAPGFPNNCVFRGVPHTLSLSQTTGIFDINGNVLLDNVTNSLVHETGWSADGAPGDGSLRCFALGAIIQHFPLTMNRTPPKLPANNGGDFRYPTDDELDALLAFQLSLGRTSTPPAFNKDNPSNSVENYKFHDAHAQTGKNLFFGVADDTNNPVKLSSFTGGGIIPTRKNNPPSQSPDRY